MSEAIKVAADGSSWVRFDPKALQEVIFAGDVPEMEQFRRYYGRAVNPAVIEQVIRAADMGFMRDLTDLEYETVRLDGHLGSVIGKRFRRLLAADYDVIPASGAGIDPVRAEKRADEVRQALAGIPNFRRALLRLTWGHFHGRASLEKEWEYRPQLPVRWWVRSLNWIHPRRLSFGPERELRVRDDMFWSGGFERRGFDLREIPFKWIQFTPQLFNDYPEREGVGPHCLYWAYFKRFDWRERMILTELFGKPWRILGVEPEFAKQVQKKQLDAAESSVNKLGANNSVVLPVGIKMHVEQPGVGAGNIHRESIVDANDEMSKIVLGQTRTTDAKPGALGTAADDVAADAETLIVASDAVNLSEILTEQLAKDIVVVNHGPEEAPYTPAIVVSVDPPPNRTQAIDNITKVLRLGVRIKAAELYERIGFERPTASDEVFELPAQEFGITPTTSGGGPAAPPSPAVSGGDDAVASAADELRSALASRRAWGELVACSKQPDTVNGSPEPLVSRGVSEASRETRRWADTIAASTEGLDSPSAIFEAMNRAADSISLAEFARVSERRVLHGLMLGALDSLWERENDEEIKAETFRSLFMAPDAGPGGPLPSQLALPFSEQPFDRAVRLFRARQVLGKDAFEQLSAAAKRRAFTIARLARTELLAAAHAELTRQIELGREGVITGQGPNLREFRKFVAERLESSGWTPANPTHVETIFRTNVMSGYGVGRRAEMAQPQVLAARPYWQWRSVRDDRSRNTHSRAHGVVLPATDPVWQRVWTPAGFNCRCRTISRSARYVEAHKLPIGPVSAFDGLPDHGFDSSGMSELLSF